MKDSTHPLMKHAKNLICQLLDKNNPTNRLGGSYSNLKGHPFFQNFDWNSLINRSMIPAHYIKSDQLLNEEKIRLLPSRAIMTYLRDWST
jgi:cGMP-dependent protein kinase